MSQLANYKLPQEIIFVEELPRSAYGKVMKAERRERYLQAKQNESQPAR